MSEATADDARFMVRAIELAGRGLYTTTPNPRVGCVLVQHGRIIGEGFHERAGGPHAEVAALAAARARGEPVAGATCYVTLEPCSHFGRTPPCADALIAARIGRVVAALEDPNPRVDGTGAARLRAAGITVVTGVLAGQAAELNPGFLRRFRVGMPYVRAKLAMSLDGRTAMASGESQWITGPAARADVQRWRARSCAIVTGAGTILADDAALTVRDLPDATPPYRQPLRVVLDRRARVPASAKVFQGDPVLWVAVGAAQLPRPANVEWLDGLSRSATPQGLLAELARRDCNEVLIEAGATLAGAFVAAELVDELLVYVAPKLLGDRARPLVELDLERMLDAVGLELLDVSRFDGDVRMHYRRVLPAHSPLLSQSPKSAMQ